ncbi:hypothetical protein ACX0G7_12650 [Flavitalea antarctica]
MLHHHNLSQTLVSADRLQLSPDCIDIFASEAASLESEPSVFSEDRFALKLTYQLNSSEIITDDVFKRLKAAGYNGVELMPGCLKEKENLPGLLNKYDLALIVRMATSGDTVDDHIASFREQLLSNIHLEPLYFTCLSGVDSWGMDEKMEFMAAALEIEEMAGIKVGHYLNRGRITCNPWDTRELLLTFPQMYLSIDFGQWVAASGRLLVAQSEIMNLCSGRCIHIHTRIWNEDGFLSPEVNDSLYNQYLNVYECWWNLIWQMQLKAGISAFGMSHFDPKLTDHRIVMSEGILYSSWINKKQRTNFNRLLIRETGFNG